MPRPEHVSPYHQFSYAAVKQTVRSQSPASVLAISTITPIALLNVALLAIASGLMLYYVVQANIIASSHYSVQTLNQEVQALSETHMDLAQQRAQAEDLSILASFAAHHQMAEAKNISYVFERSNVAYQR